MNIGIILSGFPPETIGGAEFQAFKLAQKLSSKEHQVVLFAGSRSNEIIQENPSLKIIKIKFLNVKILRIFLSQLISFLPHIKREASKLDVLICYQVTPAGMVGFVSKLFFKIPLVTWVRSESEHTFYLTKYFITPLLLKFSDQFIVQTQKIRAEIIEFYLGKFGLDENLLNNIKVIPNGIDLKNSPVFDYSHRGGILYVGRLHRVKGIKFLIKAMPGIQEKLLIIGSGPQEKELVQMSKGLNIEFLGPLPHETALSYIERSKVLVLPSLSEAQPNAILEAMSRGTPVVSSHAGGIPEILEHGKTGFLTKPGNYGQIHEYISLLLNDKELWGQMSQNDIFEARKYSWERVERALLQALEVI